MVLGYDFAHLSHQEEGIISYIRLFSQDHQLPKNDPETYYIIMKALP